MLLEFGDHLGSLAAVIDYATGELVQRTTYQTYGLTDSNYLPPRWSGLNTDQRFSGKPESAGVGLTYFGARYYQAALGTWISADPLTIHGLGSDLNPYSYVGGQPSMQLDAMGLDGTSITPRCTEGCLMARQAGFEGMQPLGVYNGTNHEMTAPITIEGVAPESASASPGPKRGPQMFTGLMKVAVMASPVVFGYALATDPGSAIRTAVVGRLEIIENLLGEPNTTSDTSYTPALNRGSEGQRAMDDTDQLLSITEQEIEGALVGAAVGRVFRGAVSLEARGAAAEICPGGICFGGGKCFAAGMGLIRFSGRFRCADRSSSSFLRSLKKAMGVEPVGNRVLCGFP